MMRLALLGVAALVVLLPAASAHCGALPRPQDTRLLSDYVDECKSDGGTNDCKNSHELIALDLQEKWDGSKDVAIFRLLMDKGGAGAHTDTIAFTTSKGAQSLAFKTSNDQSFTGTGFDAVSNAEGASDGTRFYVEGTVALDKIGKIGDKVDSLAVTADTGDIMPGTCHNTVGDCVLTTQDCYYNPTTHYALQGPTYYAKITPGNAPDIHVGAEQIVQLDLRNLIDLAQQATVTVSAGDGVTARFHDPSAPSGEGYSDSLNVPLSSKGAYGAHLAITGTKAGAQGTLTVTMTTDAGGHVTASVPYKVVAGPAPTPTSSTTTTKTANALDVPLALLAALAVVRRRT